MLFQPWKAPPRTYRIGHLIREFGVTARTLRYYEELRLLAPDRDGRDRLYSRKDRARLILILQGRAVGMSLAEIAYLFDLYERGGRAAQQADALSSFRRQLRLLEARREAAERGIAMLQSAIEQLSGPDQVPEHRQEPELGRSGPGPRAELDQPGGRPARDTDLTPAAPLAGRREEDLVPGA